MSEEFQDRKLGELPEDSRPDAQTKRRRAGASSINPPGSSPGRSQGAPVGDQVIKQGYYPQGRAGVRTGSVPPPLIDGETGAQKFTEDHPMPTQLTRDGLDYMVNMFRQMQVHVQQPAWIEPPFFSRCLDMFTGQGGVSLTAGGAFQTIVRGPFQVPTGHVGVVWYIGQEMDDPNGFDTVTWQIRKNNRPIEQYNDIGIQLGNIAFQSKLAVPIQLQPLDTVDFMAKNALGAPKTYIVYGRIMGWYFPVEMMDNTYRSRVTN